jgi:hypothetical protein
MSTGAAVTEDAAGHSNPAPAAPPSTGGGAAARAATPAPPPARSAPTHPARTQTPPAPDRSGAGVHLLGSFPALNAGSRRGHHGGSARRAVRRGGNASSSVRSQRRAGAANAAAGNPLVPHVAGASATRTPAPASARGRIRESSAASSIERSRSHAMRRNRDGSSHAVVAPPQADPSPAGHGGRPPRGVAVAAPGGTGAPSSLMVRVGFARVAASWLAGVTGEAIHLQLTVTHRLERPG